MLYWSSILNKIIKIEDQYFRYSLDLSGFFRFAHLGVLSRKLSNLHDEKMSLVSLYRLAIIILGLFYCRLYL